MKCAWQAYLNLLPTWMREDVDKQGKDCLQELRLRIGRMPELVTGKGSRWLTRPVTMDDLSLCVNAASRYSPWASATIRNGFITAQGGHRLGICGDVVTINQSVSTIKNITSLCIRVARDFPGIAAGLADMAGSTLIIGPPGSGKTTFLRDMIRQKSDHGHGPVGVADERSELFPSAGGSLCFSPGIATEVLSGCRKRDGLDMLIRTMGLRWAAVDEITAAEDASALVHAGWCGVSLLATAHAENLIGLRRRSVYKPLLESGIIENVIIMKPDKSWSLERMNLCV